MSRRLGGLAAALALYLSIGVGAATAAQPEGVCGAERGAAFTLALPAAMRSIGVHAFQYRISMILPDGTLDVGFTDNEIEVVAGTPLFDDLHLRLLRNRGLLADKSVATDVQVMDPTQPASFHAQLSLLREFEASVRTATLDVSYETTPGVWSPWTALSKGPITSLCPETKRAVLIKSYGWAG